MEPVASAPGSRRAVTATPRCEVVGAEQRSPMRAYAAGVAPRISSRAFIGRRLERSRVVGAFEARTTGPRAFVIAGEAGVGKTRFSDEIADVAVERGCHVLRGGCIDLSGESLPFAAIIEAFRSLRSGPQAPGLAALLDPFQVMTGYDAQAAPTSRSHDGAPDALTQGRLFELILNVLTRLAAEAPVLLIVEDLHWADASTLDLMAFLARNLRREAVVLLMTSRSDQVEGRHRLLSFLSELERSGRAERIELHRFDRSETAEQLAGILGSHPTAALIERVRSRSEGNPFFTEELLASEATDGPLPETLRDVLFARMSSLTDGARHLLRVAAAAGGPVDVTLLEQVTGGDRFLPALREALDLHTLVRSTSPDGGAVDFRHALLREAVYEDLLPSERAALHAAYARALGARAVTGMESERAGQLAYHWAASSDLARALPAAIRAGSAAAELTAFPEAYAQFERALGLWDRVPEAAAKAGVDRVGLLERTAAAAAAAAASLPASVRRISEAIELVDTSLDPIRAGLLYERLGRYRWLNGDGGGALVAYREALRLVPSEPATAARARVMAGLGQILMILADTEASLVVTREAVAVARAVGSRAVECHALNTLGVDTAYFGDVEAGLAMLHESLSIADAEGLEDDAARAYTNLADVLVVCGRWADAVTMGLRAAEYANDHGLGSLHGLTGLGDAVGAMYRSGRWDEAASTLQRAQQLETGGIAEIDLHIRVGMLEVSRGEHAQAHRRLELVGGLSGQLVDLQFLVPLTEVTAELAIWEGRTKDAVTAVAEGLARVAPPKGANISRFGPLYALGLRAAADDAALARQLRDPDGVDAARVRGRSLLEIVRRVGDEIDQHFPAFRGLGQAYQTLCEAEAGRLDGRAVPQAWARAADWWATLGMPYPRAYALWRQGQAFGMLRHPGTRSAEVLGEGRRIAAGLGAEPLRMAIDATASTLRIELGTGAPDRSHAFGLTAREREVLALVAAGRTNREIGEVLFVTPKTASVHVSNILRKLDVTSRTQAAAIAHQRRLA
jgi:DNA-binding CsgD family transcriptional regulator/tetratricopeptide (TPR) repeat protein